MDQGVSADSDYRLRIRTAPGVMTLKAFIISSPRLDRIDATSLAFVSGVKPERRAKTTPPEINP